MIKCCGFWSLVKCEFLDTDFSSGHFTGNESIVGDGGQTGYLFGGLQSGFFAATSTGWGTASSITGSILAATATVTAINLKSYNISD
jgi:hypothetical protein